MLLHPSPLQVMVFFAVVHFSNVIQTTVDLNMLKHQSPWKTPSRAYLQVNWELFLQYLRQLTAWLFNC